MTTSALHANPDLYRRIGRGITEPLNIKRPILSHKQEAELTASSIQQLNRELYRLRSSILVDLFPDELVVQEKTISVIKRELLVSSTQTITIKDVGRVVYVDGIIFGTLEVLGKNTAHDLRIKGLNKMRAVEAKKIIEGLILEDQAVVEMPDWIQAEEHRELLLHANTDPFHYTDSYKKPSNHE
jgi:hypothetical protein